MAFTNDQLAVFQGVAVVSGSLSVIACSCTLVFIAMRWKTIMNRSLHRFGFFVIACDLVCCLNMAVGNIPIGMLTSTAIPCHIQASLIQFSSSAGTYLLLCLGIQSYRVIFLNTPIEALRRSENYYHLASWMAPLATSLGLLLAGSPRGTPIYGSATLWCWISSAYTDYRIIFLYGGLWLIIIINLHIYIVVGLMLYSGRHDTSSDPVPAATPSSIGHGYNDVYEAYIGNDGEHMSSGMKHYSICSSLYMVAFLIAWIPPTINRFQNLADPENPVFLLVVLQAAFNPSCGWIKCCVLFFYEYSWNRRRAAKFEITNSQLYVDQTYPIDKSNMC
ncbi:uncharacterized protein BJ171DRAFT_528946 [Polychytrium aggregatum]|uniref:uncharacterized protein n=1 Tax=Polychytrium aggregatum TaxID=110093 RepID=UPI0022FF1875|nr:uncharacterized protein BJ171DRAFT_528946 [Polychytrium aggregatum]KAI9193348.1 hypothetical protein BJ171DRAFT_528946 [Polychytrium aggregatum]